MRVLINRTDAIGDCLLTTPIARFIKSKRSEAYIGFIVSPRSGELINLCEGVDEVHILDPHWGLFKKWSFLFKLFWRFKADAFFHLGGSFLPSFFAFLFLTPFRGGLKSRPLSFLLLNKGMRQSRRLVEKHESLYNIDVAGPLVGNYQNEDLLHFAPKINLNNSMVDKGLEGLNEGSSKPFILIHPGMSGHTLNWPSENYGKLIVKLFDHFRDKYQIVVSFTPSDHPYLMGLKEELKEFPDVSKKVQFFDGSKEGLVHFTHLMGQASLLIAPSTGTTHMANALGVPQIAFYSPIKVQSQKRWGPYIRGENVIVHEPAVEVFQEKGLAEEEELYAQSMAKIPVDEVFYSCLKILKE